MTFDFAPDWMTTLLSGAPYSPAAPHGSARAGAMPPPSYPDNAAVAALVSELFAEGTLSAEQLCSLAGLPELQPHLPGALAARPAPRSRKA
ncbi:hypothetical protein A6A04_12975 [Paramagnetospirillum marisnigri]|uniref:Uncharacterized protein n=1 Tax=Paramagnetospirillum marisnigri TaxID=1285242 RepID=A0A178MXD0_9PROT|nr:hypothetical protein [Paramagnetospirillum marisnigri]OAN54146.1 hypothetical protein A6A04_12975 [Paramagnetospirillum marisnigri]